MGATQDKSIPAKFHFGNALVELDHLIPRGDEPDFLPFAANRQISETEMRLDRLSLQLDELALVQSKLAFAIRDIKRSLK